MRRRPGGLGGTYAGSPLGCAAALAVLEVIKGEKLLERSLHLGERLQARLRALQKRFPAIGEIRGVGSMVAIELVKNGKAEQPDAELTRALVQAAARHGLVILSCGAYGNVIRFLAPLTIPERDARRGTGQARSSAGRSDGGRKPSRRLGLRVLADAGLGAADVRVGRRVEVFALRGDLADQALQLGRAAPRPC